MTEQLEHPDSTAGGAAVTPTQKLRDQLSAFRFNEELTPSLRRSPRNHSRFVKFEEAEDTSLPALASDAAAPPASKKRTRSALTPAVDDAPSRVSSPKKRRSESVPAKKRKGKPSVAPPEKYAHLKELTDYLGEGPDTLNGEPGAILYVRTYLMSRCGTPLFQWSSAESSEYTDVWLRRSRQQMLNSTPVPARCRPLLVIISLIRRTTFGSASMHPVWGHQSRSPDRMLTPRFLWQNLLIGC